MALSVLGSRLGRRVLWVAAIPMATTAVWSAIQLGSTEVVTAGFQLHAEKAPGIEQHVRRLAELACRARPVNDEVAP